jgi:enterochelin esterase family protein
MKVAELLLAIGCGLTAAAFVGCNNSAENSDLSLPDHSPTIAKLASELKHGNEAALADFWKQIQGHAPLVEAMAGDSHNSLVTYLWHGDDKTRRVNLVGGPSSLDGDSVKWLARLEGTDLWYRTEPVPNDSRFLYIFQVNRPEILPATLAARDRALFDLGHDDPLNPPAHGSIASLLELPDAPLEPWLEEDPAIAHGNLSEELSIDSKILNQTRKFIVYTPAGEAADNDPGWLLVVFDGEFCTHRYPTILDNLIAARKLPRISVLFVYQTENRDKELNCCQPQADFVVNELLPRVRANYHVGTEPKRVIVGGFSLGGLMAAYCAMKHPDEFGNVLSMSGSFWWTPEADGGDFTPSIEPGWLTREFATAARLPIRFFMSAGRFESSYPVSLLAENRRFRDVLIAKGYPVQYQEYSSGHATLCWYTPLVAGLTHLTGTAPSGDK